MTQPVPAVAAVIVQNARALLIRRGGPPSAGEWSIPGGAVELGENVREALIREIYEETSLKATPGEILGVVDRIVADPRGNIRFHYVIIDFLVTGFSGEAVPGSDAAEVAWVSAEELDAYGLDSEIRKVIERALTAAEHGSSPRPAVPY